MVPTRCLGAQESPVGQSPDKLPGGKKPRGTVPTRCLGAKPLGTTLALPDNMPGVMLEVTGQKEHRPVAKRCRTPILTGHPPKKTLRARGLRLYLNLSGRAMVDWHSFPRKIRMLKGYVGWAKMCHGKRTLIPPPLRTKSRVRKTSTAGVLNTVLCVFC